MAAETLLTCSVGTMDGLAIGSSLSACLALDVMPEGISL